MPSKNPMDAIVDVQQRLATHARRMAPGSLSGRSEVSSPVRRGPGVLTPVHRSSLEIPPFSPIAEAVAVSASRKWFARVPYQLVQVLASLLVAGTTTTTIEVRKNGVAVATLSLLSGEVGPKTVDLLSDFGVADALTVAVTAAGTGASGLVVEPRAA